ncbi:MAG: radical SAM protein [Clostridia bacterium]|nr:radical SAM protein [Clostridia bacterium]
MKKEYIIPIFVPHRGCPNDCTFCNQKKISGETKIVTADDVKSTIEYYLKNFKQKDKYVEVAFFGGSFTGIETDKQEELLSAAYEFILTKKVDSIRISTRPDYISKDTLKRLKRYGVKTIELGVQSTNNYVLEKAKRGHTFEDVVNASKLIRKHGFTLGHQMMIGLPESTRADEIKTAKDLIKLKPKIVRIYPVLVINGTELEESYRSGAYEPLNVEQAVEVSKDLLALFNKKKIKVIRVGLQNTNEITDPNNKNSQVVAGPYHPAFRQLVESALWYDNIAEKIKSLNMKVKKIKVEVNSSDINNVVGHKKSNIKKIKDTYGIDASVKVNNRIKCGKFKIIIVNQAVN